MTKKYILNTEEVEKLSTAIPKSKVTVAYFESSNIYIMDEHQVSVLKNKFDMDAAINNAFEIEDSFDVWLESHLRPYYIVFDYIADGMQSVSDRYRAPLDIDFKCDLKTKLHKKTLPKNKGIPTSVEYYLKKEIQLIDSKPVVVYETIVCRIDFELKYNSFGFIYEKNAILKWYFTDGTVDEVNIKNIGEIFDPVYDGEKIIKEGVDRRRAIYSGLQIPSLTFITYIFPDNSSIENLAIGREFMSYHNEKFNGFIYESATVLDPASPNFGKKEAVVALQDDDVHTWLDTVVNIGFGDMSLRQYLMEQLTI